MVSRTGGGGPPLPGVQGPQTARRERQAGSSSPRKQSLLSRETHKADGYAQGVCLGLCCAIGSTSHMWLFKTIKIKDDEKFSSLVPLGPPPGLGSHTWPVATESDGENAERAHGRGKFCWASRKPTGMRKWLGARESHGALGRDKELGDRSCLHLATSRVPGPPGEPAPPSHGDRMLHAQPVAGSTSPGELEKLLGVAGPRASHRASLIYRLSA